MNRPIKSAGSVVLVTLILMTALIIIIHSMHCTSSYLLLLAQERGHSEQNSQENPL